MKSTGADDKRVEVTFKLQDVLCPEPEVILANLESAVEVVGKVQFYSDGGSETEQFAIIEVPGINVPLVVPKSRLHEISETRKKQDAIKSLIP